MWCSPRSTPRATGHAAPPIAHRSALWARSAARRRGYGPSQYASAGLAAERAHTLSDGAIGGSVVVQSRVASIAASTHIAVAARADVEVWRSRRHCRISVTKPAREPEVSSRAAGTCARCARMRPARARRATRSSARVTGRSRLPVTRGDACRAELARQLDRIAHGRRFVPELRRPDRSIVRSRHTAVLLPDPRSADVELAAQRDRARRRGARRSQAGLLASASSRSSLMRRATTADDAPFA